MKPGDTYIFHSATALPRYVKRNGQRVILLYRSFGDNAAWMVLFPATDRTEAFGGLAFDHELKSPSP